MGLKARLDEVQKEQGQKSVDELIHHLRKAIERNGEDDEMEETKEVKS